MSVLIYIAIGVVIAVSGIVLAIILRPKQTRTPIMDLSSMVTILDKHNVKQLRFVRNKIVVDMNDITLFDAEALRDTGVTGITIVGDTVKFYVEGDGDINHRVFEQLQQELER